jgi:EAL domain-containing protein (putative c-di-GMP-specific phosphodiesterase class I)
MVKVYFERSGYAELVAKFDSEETYDACLPALEELAKENGFEFVSESVEEEEEL